MSDDIILRLEEQDEICMELDGPPVPGKTGNGIASIVMNPDYTLTITYTNGDSYTTPSIRGEEGNGIASIVVNPDYTMTITMDDGTQYTTPDMQGPQGDTGTGITSIIKTGTSENVDTYTITFTDGTSTTFTVTNGLDGVSPSISVSQITGGHRVTIIDAGGTSTFDVMDGAQGDPGFSPTISVVDITGGHRITITDEYGPHVVDVMDGANGQGVPAGGTTGQVLRKNGNADFSAEWSDETVKDVQINGTTILASGVANIPYADANTYGLVKTGAVTVSGTTPTITGVAGVRYICGEVSTLDIVVPASGLFEVDFESGSTATVLTTTGTTVTWPSWFDPTDLDADTLYEISIQDGKGLVATWPA